VVTSETKNIESCNNFFYDRLLNVSCSIRCKKILNPLKTESESYVTTDSQSASLSWNRAPIWGLQPDINYCLRVAVLLIWGVLSDERMGLSFVLVAGPCQRSQSRVRVPLDS
jgi:hypothetical protein